MTGYKTMNRMLLSGQGYSVISAMSYFLYQKATGKEFTPNPSGVAYSVTRKSLYVFPLFSHALN